MSQTTQKRTRAIRLTPQGLELVETTLFERLKGTKFTRDIKAKHLDISPRTMDKVLARKGVDKTTLIHIFKRLDLTWSDAYGEGFEEAPPEKLPAKPLWATAFALLALLMVITSMTGNRKPDWQAEFLTLLMEGSNKYHQGKLDEAEPLLNQALLLAIQNNHEASKASALRMAGDLQVARGEYEIAEGQYKKALNLRKELLDRVSYAAIQDAIGVLYTAMGKYKLAREYLTQALEGYSQSKEPVGMAMVQRDMASLSLEEKDLPNARLLIHMARAQIQGQNKPDIETDIDGVEALIFREQGLYTKAKDQLQRCVAYWQQQDHPRWIAYTNMQLASIELLEGNVGKATDLLAKSKRTFEGLQDSPGVKKVDQWLRKATEQSKGAA